MLLTGYYVSIRTVFYGIIFARILYQQLVYASIYDYFETKFTQGIKINKV